MLLMALASFALVMVFPALVIFAAVRDATSFTIPNWISLAIVAAFLPAAALLHLPLLTVLGALGVGFAFLVAGMGMFALRWIGGGDAKLFAACGLWLGWPAAPAFLVWTAVAGGVLALALLSGRKWAGYYPGARPQWITRLVTPGGDIPYGLAIAAGALAAFPTSLLMHPPLQGL